MKDSSFSQSPTDSKQPEETGLPSETLTGVREYAEGYPVELGMYQERLVIQAWNEGHCNLTEVDLLDLLKWARENKPELYAP